MRRLLNLQPRRPLRLALFLAPVAAMLVTYLAFSDARLAENPQDRLLPAFSTMGDTLLRMATEPDRRSGDLLFWLDTGVSLQRLALGVGLGALTALVLGVASGLIPLAGASLSPLLAIIAMVPPPGYPSDPAHCLWGGRTGEGHADCPWRGALYRPRTRGARARIASRAAH